MSAKQHTQSQHIDQSAALVKRVWSFCNVLRDEGVGASDYLEQITFLLFLKMADELDRDMPAEWNWKILKSKTGSELKDYYEKFKKKYIDNGIQLSFLYAVLFCFYSVANINVSIFRDKDRRIWGF